MLSNIFKNLVGYFSIFSSFSIFGVISSIVEILIISFLIYSFLIWVKNTRAWTLLKGIIVILIFVIIAFIFQFSVILWLLEQVTSIAVIAIVVIFQDDLRNALEHLGRQRFFSKFLPNFNKFNKKTSDTVVQEIATAAFSMSQVKTGALIVIEQTESLEQIEKTGIAINGKVTNQLLINIFEKNTPLHDGAVLIVGDIIKAATCYLPLSDNNNISKKLGTRHRAALGVSEISDSVTIVVSEETGNVSFVYYGEIKTMHNEKELIQELLSTIYKQTVEDENKKNSFKEIFLNEKISS